MTGQFYQVPAQSPQFTTYIASALTGLVIVLAGILSFAPYSLI